MICALRRKTVRFIRRRRRRVAIIMAVSVDVLTSLTPPLLFDGEQNFGFGFGLLPATTARLGAFLDQESTFFGKLWRRKARVIVGDTGMMTRILAQPTLLPKKSLRTATLTPKSNNTYNGCHWIEMDSFFFDESTNVCYES